MSPAPGFPPQTKCLSAGWVALTRALTRNINTNVVSTNEDLVSVLLVMPLLGGVYPLTRDTTNEGSGFMQLTRDTTNEGNTNVVSALTRLMDLCH